MPLTPAQRYQLEYKAARAKYREELRKADERFDLAMQESIRKYNETVKRAPWLRAQETERHTQVELVASLMHDKIAEHMYERFREAVRQAAIRAWGMGK